jgi:ABC-type transport system substrate-binding protein
VIKSVPDEMTRAAALKRGEVDIAYSLNGPIAEDIRRTPGLKLVATRTNTVFFLDFVEQQVEQQIDDINGVLGRGGAPRRSPMGAALITR